MIEDFVECFSSFHTCQQTQNKMQLTLKHPEPILLPSPPYVRISQGSNVKRVAFHKAQLFNLNFQGRPVDHPYIHVHDCVPHNKDAPWATS